MPLVHFDRQTVFDFFNIPIEEAGEAIKQIEYKDPIDIHDDFSGDDVKAIAMTYAHRNYPSATNSDKVSFGSQVSYLVCGMYTGVAHYVKEQKAERVFEELRGSDACWLTSARVFRCRDGACESCDREVDRSHKHHHGIARHLDHRRTRSSRGCESGSRAES